MAEVVSRGRKKYYHQDVLGSTRAITDGSGSVLTTRGYDVYGNLRYQSRSVTGVHQYTGEQRDESGLYYLRASCYD